MMIKDEDFIQHEGSKSAQKAINEFGVTIYFRQTENDTKFTISGYVTGFKNPKYICRADTIKDCNDVFLEICEKLTFLSKFQNNINFTAFFSELKKNYAPSEKQRRFNDTSDDGIISVRVKKEEKYGGWIPIVRDYEKGTKNYRGGHISSVVSTENEAEEICKNCLNEYNIYGAYSRTIKNHRCNLEHETFIELNDTINEFYVFGNNKRTDISEVQYTAIMNILNMGSN